MLRELNPTSSFFKCHWNLHILVIKNFLPQWRYKMPRSVSRHGPAWTYWCWFQKGSEHCFRIHLRSLCCWRHLGEKDHALDFGTGWRKSVSIPKISNKRCEWIIIIIWIFDSVSKNSSERFFLYVRQSYIPLVLPYSKTRDFYFPFMTYNNHIFLSVKDMKNVE